MTGGVLPSGPSGALAGRAAHGQPGGREAEDPHPDDAVRDRGEFGRRPARIACICSGFRLKPKTVSLADPLETPASRRSSPVALLEQIAAAVRPHSLETQVLVMADADQRDLLPHIAVPTLLIWGELDVRSPLSVAHQFEHAIPDTTLVVIPDCGHVSTLEAPDRVNRAMREFCRAHPPR